MKEKLGKLALTAAMVLVAFISARTSMSAGARDHEGNHQFAKYCSECECCNLEMAGCPDGHTWVCSLGSSCQTHTGSCTNQDLDLD